MSKIIYVLNLFATSFFFDKTKVKGVPFTLVNWFALALVGGYLWIIIRNEAIGNMRVVAIVVFFATLGAILGRTAVLVYMRTKKRRYIYKLWSSPYALRRYDDRNKDSSKFVRITWDGLRATRVLAHGEVGRLHFSRMRLLKATLDNLDQDLPTKHGKWVLDFEQAKSGFLDARIVQTNTLEYIEFYSRTRLYELVQNVLNYMDFPQIEFENSELVDGKIQFDAIFILNMAVQDLNNTYQIKRMYSTIVDIFPVLPSHLKWEIITSNAGQVEIRKVDAQDLLNREEKINVDDAVARAWKYEQGRVAAKAFIASNQETVAPPVQAAENMNSAKDELPSEVLVNPQTPTEPFKIRELPETQMNDTPKKFSLPPLAPLPKTNIHE